MYIERQALLNKLEAIKESADWDSQSKYVLFGIKEFINNAPAADVVAVVRCQSCKHAVWDEEEQLWKCVISADWNEDIGEYVGFVEYHDADDFCSYGERRDTDG